MQQLASALVSNAGGVLVTSRTVYLYTVYTHLPKKSSSELKMNRLSLENYGGKFNFLYDMRSGTLI